MRIGATLLVAALLVVAGCSAPNGGGGQSTATPERTTVPDDGLTNGTDSDGSNGGETELADPASDRIGWESGYEKVLEHWGADPLGNRTWRISDDLSPYDDNAYHLTVEDDTVTIVNAPTIDELGDVYGPAGG